MALPPNTYERITGVHTIPSEGTAGPGTVTVPAANLTQVQGTGTNFAESGLMGWYIFFPTVPALRRIIGTTNTSEFLQIEHPLAAAIGPVAYHLIQPRYRKVVLQNTAGNAATITNPTTTAAQTMSAHPVPVEFHSQSHFVPVQVLLIDGGVGGVDVTVTQ